MLHGGIVTARVMGGDLRLHIEASRAAERGSLPSPDMYYAFNVKDSGVNFITIDVDSSEDIDAVVAQATRGGASAIKMAAEIEIRAPVMRRLADAAHQAGLRVWAHARVFFGRPIDVVRAGVDGVSHTCGFAWQDPDLDPARDRRDGPGSRRTFDPALVDVDGPEMRTLFEEMVRRGTVFDPTLVLQSRPAVARFGCTSELLVALIRAAHRAGVSIAAGTDFHANEADLYPSLHQEIERLVSSGVLTPLEAITAATRNGARALGREKILGILTADPSRDIRALRSVVTVVKHGRLYARSDYLARR
jgi:imidazolonepropionase-like amidohydrolase